MQLFLYLIFVLLIVGADQFTKYLTVANIALGQDVEFIPGFLGLTYVQNTGAAFSSFEGMLWLFVLIFAVFTGALIWEYRKQSLHLSAFDWWCVMAVYGGGLGNMIDRLRLGYVVDMIETKFIRFPVFNVADCFITCGCIAIMVSLIFFNKEFWKEEKK